MSWKKKWTRFKKRAKPKLVAAGKVQIRLENQFKDWTGIGKRQKKQQDPFKKFGQFFG